MALTFQGKEERSPNRPVRSEGWIAKQTNGAILPGSCAETGPPQPPHFQKSQQFARFMEAMPSSQFKLLADR